MRTLGLLAAIGGLSWNAMALGGGITVAENGQARAAIVLADDASAPQRHAAEELAAFLGQVTGAEFSIASQLDRVQGNLLVGPKAASLADPAFSSDGLGQDGIVIWDYVVNFSYPLTPHPNLRVLGPNMRFLVDHGVKGCFAEALPQSPGLEMAELRNWVLAKLMWNPKLDGNALVEQFVNGYYGPAAKHILAYINLMHDAVEKSDDYLGLGSPPDPKFLSLENLCLGWRHLQDAEEAVGADQALRLRVRIAHRTPSAGRSEGNGPTMAGQIAAAGGLAAYQGEHGPGAEKPTRSDGGAKEDIAADLQLQQFITEWCRCSVANGLSAYADRNRSFDVLFREMSRRFAAPTVVETGTIRAEEDWGGAGLFTYLAGAYLYRRGGRLHSVDVGPGNCTFARAWTQVFGDAVHVTCQDSIEFLGNFGDSIDVLYLDSLDTTEPGHAEHALREVQAAMPKLHEKSLVVFDDTPWHGGAWIGKGAKAVPFLLQQGWTVLYAGYQVVLGQAK